METKSPCGQKNHPCQSQERREQLGEGECGVVAAALSRSGMAEGCSAAEICLMGDQGSLSLEEKREGGMGKWPCVISITSLLGAGL